MKQYGIATYAPPLQKDPSTTTRHFPKRVDILGVLGDLAARDAEDTMSCAHASRTGGTAAPESFLNITGNFGDPPTGAKASAPPVAAAARSPGLPAITAGATPTTRFGGKGGSDGTERALNILLGDDDGSREDGEDVLFDGMFFDFLDQRPPQQSLKAASTNASAAAAQGPTVRSSPSAAGIAPTTAIDNDGVPSWMHGLSLAAVPFSSYHDQVNPHRIPTEVFTLHREAWTLLMDNRAVAWLERESREKGRTAAQVRRRLLEVISSRGPAPRKPAGGGGGGGPLDSQTWRSTSNTDSAQAGLAERCFSDDNDDLAAGSTLSSPHAGTMTVPSMSEETAQQRVYEGFQPFFAVISPPSILRRLRDQFNASRRMQLRGTAGSAADLVGLPLFSQFATWREAYNHRKTWDGTPFSFFLIHDASYNYGHISALYVLLQNICASCHTHSTSRCLLSGGAGETVMLGEASYLMTNSNDIMRAAEAQRNLCPMFAIQQVTEDIILAYEQSSSRTTLTMALHVLSFLTDIVIDAETADRFISTDALRRQSTYVVPGMPTGARAGNASPAESSDQGSPAASPHRPLSEMLSAKRFSDADFEALFDLSFWFLDAAVANSRLPVDPALLPARPKAPLHPEQETLGPPSTTPSLTTERSMTLGSVHSTAPSRTGSAGTSGRIRRAKTGARKSPQRGSRHHGAGASVVISGASTPDNDQGGASQGSGLPSSATECHHQYVPGRIQLYPPVSSLVEVIIQHDSRCHALLELQAAEAAVPAATKSMSFTGSISEHNELPEGSPRPTRKKLTRRRPQRESAIQQMHMTKLSPSTTLLATPLIFITSYIRLHGAPWLKTLFSRIFNILRRESVLLYVNRLDLEHPQHFHQQGVPTGPGTTSSIRVAPPPRRGQNNINTSRSMQTGASASSSSPLSPRSPRSKGFALDSSAQPTVEVPAADAPTTAEQEAAFYARMERLEDLVCQDILYALGEFFSALHGRRSATRLPQGITSLITQFTATIHLHLLGNVVLTSDLAPELSGAAVRKVNDSLARLKQRRVANKAFRAEQASDSSVSRLIRSIDQFRLTKFILFDCWIIPALNNAVSTGYLAENSTMHLRWNIDAFARYLKILVNSPFLEDREHVEHLREAAGAGAAAAAAAERLNLSATARASTFNAATRRRRQQPSDRDGSVPDPSVAAAPTAPPPTVPLPRYITGIYDVSSGSLVHVGHPREESTAVSTSAMHRSDSSSNAAWPQVPSATRRRSMTMVMQSSDERLLRAKAPAAMVTAAGSPAAAAAAAAGTAAGAPPAPEAPPTFAPSYTTMDDAGWERVSSAMKGLNEALGVTGYDPEEMGGRRSAGSNPLNSPHGSLSGGLFGTEGSGGLPGFADTVCAMRVLDLFCRRASLETANNVVVSEFEVLPTMAAGCVDKIHEMMTGQHPLIEQATRFGGPLPNTYGHSPYLACLHGVLLHPKSAARALDNVYHNANRFYQALMKPVQNEGLISLVSALVVDQDDLPVVDSNALLPLLQTVRAPPLRVGVAGTGTGVGVGRANASSTARTGAGATSPMRAATAARGDSSLMTIYSAAGHAPNGARPAHAAAAAASQASRTLATPLPPAAPVSVEQIVAEQRYQETLSVHARWEAEARKFKQQRLFLSTGAMQGVGPGGRSCIVGVHATLDRVGPPDPFVVLKAGSDLIQREARVVPMCFDPWWRAMALSLCVKAVSVFTECSPAHSEAFEEWCVEKMDAAQKDSRLAREAFIKAKGHAALEDVGGDDKRRRRTLRNNSGSDGNPRATAAVSPGDAGGRPSKKKLVRRPVKDSKKKAKKVK